LQRIAINEALMTLRKRGDSWNFMRTQIIREPRWPAFVAMLAAAGVYLALPAPLALGPSWLLLLVIVLLLIPIVAVITM
jgi:hypothetical protein